MRRSVTDNLRFGVEIEGNTTQEITRQTVLAEKLGYDSAWWTDHFSGSITTMPLPELFTTMALMACHTKRILIGSAVTDVSRRHPSVLAQTIATLDQISNGRAILGLGAGEATNSHPMGIPTDHMCSRLREGIEFIDRLLLADPQHPASFAGRHFTMRNAFLQVKSVQTPRPPIYVGSYGENMLRLTGALADGWIPFAHTPETYRKALEGALAEGLRKAGRTPEDVEMCYAPNATVSEDRENARMLMEPIGKTGVAIMPVQYEMLTGKRHPGFRFSMAGVPSLKDMASLKATVPPEAALKTVIWGTPDDCIAQIEAMARAGCQHLIFALRGENMDHVIRTFAAKVIPHFRKGGVVRVKRRVESRSVRA